MSYNWEKIIKNKTDTELYSITMGKTFMSEYTVKLAKSELTNRGINDGNIEKHKLKWKIEKDINDEFSINEFDIGWILSSLFSSIISIIALIHFTINYVGLKYILIFSILAIAGAYFAISQYKQVKDKIKDGKEKKERINYNDL